MRLWLFFGMLGAVAAAQGCVTGFTATSGSDSGAGGSATSGTSSVSVSASGAGGNPTIGSGTGGPACVDVRGAYTLTPVGAGCGDLDPTASECLTETPNTCVVLFASKEGTLGKGIDGTVTLDGNGDFTKGALRLGSVDRGGCTGTWAPATSVMTVDCGGTATTQSCTVTLTRKNGPCAN